MPFAHCVGKVVLNYTGKAQRVSRPGRRARRSWSRGIHHVGVAADAGPVPPELLRTRDWQVELLRIARVGARVHAGHLRLRRYLPAGKEIGATNREGKFSQHDPVPGRSMSWTADQVSPSE